MNQIMPKQGSFPRGKLICLIEEVGPLLLHRLLLAGLVCLLFGCEEALHWQTTSPAPSLLVVEGRITNELRSHTVRLSQTVEQLNGQPPAVAGAVVRVYDGQKLYTFTEASPGIYESEVFRGLFGKAYVLYIRLGQKEYRAITYMVPVSPLGPLRLLQEAGGYRYALQPSDLPAMEEVWLDWSEAAGYEGLPATATSARLLYYSLQTLDVPQLFAPEQEQVLFPSGTRIIRRKYSLSPEQQAFARSLLFETDWQGSPFDTERGNVITNLSEGAVGYFAANTVVVDTAYAE